MSRVAQRNRMASETRSTLNAQRSPRSQGDRPPCDAVFATIDVGDVGNWFCAT